MKKDKLSIIFILLITLLFGNCLSVSKTEPVSLPDSLFNANLSENSQLRISNNVSIIEFNEYKTYWGPGTNTIIPAGRHTIVIWVEALNKSTTLQHTFNPGKCYMIDWETTKFETDTQSRTGYGGYTATTIITYIDGDLRLRDYGVTEFAIPRKNESIIEIKGGSYTRLYVNNDYYKLSSYLIDAAESVRFILPSGKHNIRSLATVEDINLELLPNRHIVYSVNTMNASWTKIQDEPLKHIGKWYFNIDENRSITLAFNTKGNGYLGIYNKSILAEGSGAFTYTVTDTSIIINNPNEPSLVMPYQISADQNSLYLDNFLGSSTMYVGLR